MKQIIATTPGFAWLQATKIVLENGYLIKDGSQNLKEILNVMITVTDPISKDEIIEKYADKKMIDWMKNNFLSKNYSENNKFNYSQRLFSYNGINQISKIIS